jgi:hypothetical protein
VIGRISGKIKVTFEGAMPLEEYRVNVFLIFYKVGLVGLKIDKFTPMSWTDQGGVSISKAEVTGQSRAAIHKAFWRCLGVSENGHEQE